MEGRVKKCDLINDKSSEMVSFDECKKKLDKFNLNDEEIRKIRNGLIGITNSVINSYLDEFDKH